MLKKIDNTKAKYRVVLTDGISVNEIYYKSLYLAHRKASELRRIFGIDNVRIIDLQKNVTIEGL